MYNDFSNLLVVVTLSSTPKGTVTQMTITTPVTTAAAISPLVNVDIPAL
jgi:hypothetical protein